MSKQRLKTTRRSQMNVAKNWALTIMLTALAFAHFLCELLLKEQMITPVKKTLNNAGHTDAKLIDFSEICQKKSSEIGCFFTDCFFVKFPPEIFPVKSADFSKNLPLKNLRNLPFSAKIPRNRPIFLRILTFLLRKSLEIGRFFREFWLFFREIGRFFANFDFFSREISRFFREFAPENPAKFCFFFSAKYQKPWIVLQTF